ncbi:hypothetical protein TNCV_4756381 [Trichonephila clavipes]|nr:hypothetical protein TNCV_4756381 [Trichonephila clavipes]
MKSENYVHNLADPYFKSVWILTDNRFFIQHLGHWEKAGDRLGIFFLSKKKQNHDWRIPRDHVWYPRKGPGVLLGGFWEGTLLGCSLKAGRAQIQPISASGHFHL